MKHDDKLAVIVFII